MKDSTHINGEKLNPELARCFGSWEGGRMIRHPLVHEIFYVEAMNAYYNESLKRKKCLRSKAIKDGNWTQYIFVHERPYRFDALTDLLAIAELPRDIIAGLIKQVWVDSENVWQHKAAWLKLLSEYQIELIGTGDEAETNYIATAPETITVYRGCQQRNQSGLAWTIDKERAIWFAKRWQDGRPILVEGVVKKEHVLAAIFGRSESELVISPRHIGRKKLHEVF